MDARPRPWTAHRRARLARPWTAHPRERIEAQIDESSGGSALCGPLAWTSLCIASLIVAGVACDNVENLTLPSAPDADVAFGVLYAGDRPVRIGEVVDPRQIYAGDYALRDEDDALDPRLYFLQGGDLVRAGSTACETLSSAVDRLGCRTTLDACVADPIACLRPAPLSEGCGDRLQYPDVLPLIAMQGDGVLVAEPATAAAVSGLALCGPVIRPPCPNLRAGLIVTDDLGVRCIAPVAQTECRIDIDLSTCGLSPVAAHLDAEGGLQAETDGCAFIAASSVSAAGGPAYLLDCAGSIVGITIIPELIAEAECRRNGPAVYETEAVGNAEITGRIHGLSAIQPSGWPVRWVMTGTGIDSCGRFGCRRRGLDCTQCNVACDQFEIKYCALTEWPACVGIDRQQTCKQRCQTFCQRAAADPDGCFREVEGNVITTSDLNAPELIHGRFRLNDSLRGPLGDRALVRLGSAQDPTLIAAGRDGVHAFRPGATVDSLVETSTLGPGFQLAGVVASDNSVVAFGRGRLGGARWSRLRVDGGRLALEIGPVREDRLPEADLGAISDGHLFLTARRAVAGADAPPLVAVDLQLSDEPTVISQSGTPVDLVALPATRALVAIQRPRGESVLALAEAGVDRLAAETSLWPGLVVRGLAVDDRRCDVERCVVWVAYEQVHRSGPAMVGYVEIQDEITIGPALATTPVQRVGILAIDPLSDAVIAVANTRNEIGRLSIRLP